VGDLGNEVNDEALANAFRKYPSFAKAKVVRDKHSRKSKGFGFVSFMDPLEGLKGTWPGGGCLPSWGLTIINQRQEQSQQQ
jgi:hypothetical protein